GNEAPGPASRAVDQVRAGDQRSDRPYSRPRAAAHAAGPRRRGDRVMRREVQMKLPRRNFLHFAAGAAALPPDPPNNLAEFIAYAKANPGKINFASGGVGTSPHLSGELLKTMAGINLVHVPYRGTAPALADLLAGQVQVVFDNIPGSIGHIKTGKVRA